MTYDIKCAQIRELVDNGGQLIDVRSNHEFTQGALKNAVNVPVESVPYCANTIDRNKPVMLYCVSGTRANLVKHFLESLGFNNVYNLGGMSQLAHC
ncbi:MAG: rhodanese-like domain-containing protein [Gammaproteobacteria bacterium]|nr:rhodanese-like domain-containing protein [Gammaproteobacteria bacterium]